MNMCMWLSSYAKGPAFRLSRRLFARSSLDSRGEIHSGDLLSSGSDTNVSLITWSLPSRICCFSFSSSVLRLGLNQRE